MVKLNSSYAPPNPVSPLLSLVQVYDTLSYSNKPKLTYITYWHFAVLRSNFLLHQLKLVQIHSQIQLLLEIRKRIGNGQGRNERETNLLST